MGISPLALDMGTFELWKSLVFKLTEKGSLSKAEAVEIVEHAAQAAAIQSGQPELKEVAKPRKEAAEWLTAFAKQWEDTLSKAP